MQYTQLSGKALNPDHYVKSQLAKISEQLHTVAATLDSQHAQLASPFQGSSTAASTEAEHEKRVAFVRSLAGNLERIGKRPVVYNDSDWRQYKRHVHKCMLVLGGGIVVLMGVLLVLAILIVAKFY